VKARSELVIYADESHSRGGRYGNFYGGALIDARDLEFVRASLIEAKRAAGLEGSELKWNAITPRREEAYLRLVEAFFDLIEQGLVKMRVMFTDNRHEALNLEDYHRNNRYHLLYYEFVKHAFGLAYCDLGGPTRLRVYLDNMPQNREKVRVFKARLAALSSNPEFRRAGLFVPEDQIAEVNSGDHVIMQTVDVVLGSMQFRMNRKHKAKPEGSRTRGKKTRSKENVYKAINARIRSIYPHFNVGISTGHPKGREDRWHHGYRHWLFVPSQHRVRSVP